MELFHSNVIGVVERGRYSDQNWKNTSLAFAISQPPPPLPLSSIHSTLLSCTYQSPPLFPSISLCLPDHFTLLSSSPLPSGLYLCLVFSLQPFHFSHHLLHFCPFNPEFFHSFFCCFHILISVHTFLLRVVRTWKGWICFFSRSQATASESRTQDTTESFFTFSKTNDIERGNYIWRDKRLHSAERGRGLFKTQKTDDVIYQSAYKQHLL